MNVLVTKLKLCAEIVPFLEWTNKAKPETQQGINKIPHLMELRQILWMSQTTNIFLVWEVGHLTATATNSIKKNTINMH